MSSSFVVVFTTMPSLSKARSVAQKLLQKRLAACVNVIGGIDSYFWWKGKIDRVKETLLLIKTRASRFPDLCAFLEKHHPYSVPEIIALPIRKGNASYLKWLVASTR